MVQEEEFEPQLAELLGVSAPGLIDRMFAGSKTDEPMLSAVRAARRAGIRTGLISNSWGTRRYDRSQLNELFDGVVISGEVGVRKPEPRIYELGAEAIGLPPADCVFVDDLPGNLKPARELGMATVHHTSAEDTILQEEFGRETGWPDAPNRVLKSCFEHAQQAKGPVGQAGPIPVDRFATLPPTPDCEGDIQAMAMYAGQSVGSVTDIRPAADIVAELMGIVGNT